ncbi:MAG: hypothetical protein NWF07_08695, partial [Candidatus Bathyarchaeota archaeon]|nr:hypothetical protein [Candidatus Bathyarchaeota archaeon]
GHITNNLHTAIYIVDLTTQEYLGRLDFIPEEPRGGPDSIALTPDNEYFIVTRGKYSNDILVIDANNYSLVKQVPGGKYNGPIEVNARLNEAYILSGNYQDTNLYILDLENFEITETIDLKDELGNLALSSNTLCVTTKKGITFIDTISREVINQVAMNTSYWKRVVSHPELPVIYVVNNPSVDNYYPFIQVFDVETGENLHNIKHLTVNKTWDGGITGLAITPDGGCLFSISQMNELVVVNTTDYSRIITRSVKQPDYYGKPDWVYFNENCSKAYFIYWGGIPIDTPMPDTPSLIGVMDMMTYEFTEVIEIDEYAGLGMMAVRKHDSTPDMQAYIMVNRYAYSSTNHTMVTITDETLERSPILSEAFRIEAYSHAIGLVHPIEWVICTDEEGRTLEELIESLPSSGSGSIHLEYQGEKFQFTIKYDTEPPMIC